MPSSDTSATNDRPGPLPRLVPADDARNPWAFVRTLTTQPATSAPDQAHAGEDSWTEEERLDELFSSWAEAALSAEVIADRRFMDDDAEPAPALPRASAAPPAAQARAVEADPVSSVAGPWVAEGPLAVPPADAGPATASCQPLSVWSPGDDDIIPRPRARRRLWGR